MLQENPFNVERKVRHRDCTDITCAQREGKKKNSRNKQRTIAFKLLRFKDKQNILRKAKVLKETDSFINKDYCRDSVEHRKERLEEMNLLQS